MDDGLLFADCTNASNTATGQQGPDKLTPDMARQVVLQADKEQLYLAVVLRSEGGVMRIARSSKVSDSSARVIAFVSDVCNAHNDLSELELLQVLAKATHDKLETQDDALVVVSPHAHHQATGTTGAPRFAPHTQGRFTSREEADGRVVVTFFPSDDPATKQSTRFAEAYRVEKRVASFLMTERWSKQWAELEKDGKPLDWPRGVEFTSPYKMSRQVTQEFISDCLKWAAELGHLHLIAEARTRMGDVKRPTTAQWFFEILSSLGCLGTTGPPHQPQPQPHQQPQPQPQQVQHQHQNAHAHAHQQHHQPGVVQQLAQPQPQPQAQPHPEQDVELVDQSTAENIVQPEPSEFHQTVDTQNLIFHLMQQQQQQQQQQQHSPTTMQPQHPIQHTVQHTTQLPHPIQPSIQAQVPGAVTTIETTPLVSTTSTQNSGDNNNNRPRKRHRPDSPDPTNTSTDESNSDQRAKP